MQARKKIRKFAKPSSDSQRGAQEINDCPSEEEVMKTWNKMKEKAGDLPEVVPLELKEKIIHVVHKMFESPAEELNDKVKIGIMIHLRKKGPKERLDN